MINQNNGLRPCPVCGCSNLFIISVVDPVWSYIKCADCGYGVDGKIVSAISDYWNSISEMKNEEL